MSDDIPGSGQPDLKTMRLEIDGDLGTLVLDRPDALNSMSPEMIGELAIIAPWLADRAPIRSLVVTGEGRAFSAGGDVTWFRRGLDDPDLDLVASVRRGADVLHQAIVDFRRIPYPVIAAVNGPAAGAGFSLALMCDIRIASDQAWFVCAYGRIGASPDGGMTFFLPRVIGPAAALELMLEDPDMSAADALERGLVSQVVEHDRLLEVATEKARDLGAKSPALHADGEEPARRQPRQLDRRPPPARAPRDRRQHGHRGPAQRGREVLRGREADVRGPLSGSKVLLTDENRPRRTP